MRQRPLPDGLYAFEKEFRYGLISGLFLAHSSEVDRVMGKTVYLSEVLGKHSEVVVEINSKTLKLISNKEEVINLVKDNYDILIGYNIVSMALNENEEEDD